MGINHMSEFRSYTVNSVDDWVYNATNDNINYVLLGLSRQFYCLWYDGYDCLNNVLLA